MYSLWEIMCDQSEVWRISLPFGREPSAEQLECRHGGAVTVEEFRPDRGFVRLFSGHFSRVHDDVEGSTMTPWQLWLVDEYGSLVRVSQRALSQEYAMQLFMDMVTEEYETIARRWDRLKLGNLLDENTSPVNSS